MPDYAYHAVDKFGRSADGTMVADDEKALERRLGDLGIWLIDANEESVKKRSVKLRVPRRDLIEIFYEMSSLLSAGIPIADAITALADETAHPSLKFILDDIGVNVQSGQELSKCFEKYPKVFSPQVCNLVGAGEHSGNLTETFKDLSEHLEWVEHILGDIKQASIYPLMIILAVTGLIGVMFIVVVPTFSKLFLELDVELPALTRGVIALGDFSSKYWWLIIGVVAMVTGALINLKKIAPQLGYIYDQNKLALPIFGPILAMLAQSQVVHNLALMLRAGVPIVDALHLCRGLTNNEVMDTAIADAEYAVKQGNRMSEAFRAHKIMSSFTLRLMVVGEESGHLDRTLQQVANRFDDDIPRKIKRVFAIVEPVITITLVVVVGLIAAAVFLPMFRLMTSIGV